LATFDEAALTIRYAQLFHLGINRGRLRKTRALFVPYETGHVQAKLAMRSDIPEYGEKPLNSAVSIREEARISNY
jgi:hypothetical protein